MIISTISFRRDRFIVKQPLECPLFALTSDKNIKLCKMKILEPRIYLNISAHAETFCGRKHKEHANGLHATLELPDLNVEIKNIAFLKETGSFFKQTTASSQSSVAVHLAAHEPCVKFKDHLSSLLKEALEESVATSIENMIRDWHDCDSATKAKLQKAIASKYKKIKIALTATDGNYGLITGRLDETILIFGCEQQRPTFLTDIRTRPMANVKLHFQPSALGLEKCHKGKEHAAAQAKFQATFSEFMFVKAPENVVFANISYVPGPVQPAAAYNACTKQYRQDLPKVVDSALTKHLTEIAVAAFTENRDGMHMKQIEVAPCAKPEIIDSAGDRRRRRRGYSSTSPSTCR